MKPLLASCIAMGAASAAFGADLPANRFHNDHREGVQKVVFVAPQAAKAGIEGEQAAWHYLQNHIRQFGLAGTDQLELVRRKESLLGGHYHFNQVIDGVSVHRGEVVVSVSLEDGQVYRVYNNLYPAGAAKNLRTEAQLDLDDAYDIAWEQLRVHGDMTLRPDARLVLQPIGASLRLVYLVDLSVEAPYGDWRHTIDAQTGEVLEVERRGVSSRPEDVDPDDYDGPILDRSEAFARFEARKSARKAKGVAAKATVDGTGVVFLNDPRTALMTDALEDTSPAADFDGAYVTRTLRDITLESGEYRLEGPYVRIVDFEAPPTPPSTTTDGNWDARRGDNAFNEANAYFHIDQSQRYLQSLGFSGAKGIQDAGIRLDTDAVNGDDNSFYVHGPNVIKMGRGCVDDSEEAFTLLHEYGHAIHFDINDNWSGGDTGAMGEGFGDYWAGSYRYSTPNGRAWNPNWAFPWVGHNPCWEGRVLDNTVAQYDPSETYDAHVDVHGHLSDELWSTPLFQSMRTLIDRGVPREEVDTLLVESLFGTSADMTMRDMATLIVDTAERLYPAGPHAEVFTEKFRDQNILEANDGQLQSGVAVTVSGDRNSTEQFTIEVPANARKLTIETKGGSGDADLYVKFGAEPGLSDFDRASLAIGNGEDLTFRRPKEGTYHIMLHGYSAYSDLELVATVEDGGSGPRGGWVSSQSFASILRGGSHRDYTIDVAGDSLSLELEWGGSVDFDLVLLDASGNEVGRSVTGNPETLQLDTTGKHGAYTARVINNGGSYASFSLKATQR
ncbi:pre-peptidase C-terminal domain-containing protein [Sulfidibacter corallicola]|uniref:Pre-peptidase C-terminal domain-containing protein n=1 Tax=Sulfidibacter corallicola TaxID=2818388 RepID=A0A8A4TG47_SULCO|nr:pre-peptidase C-terminal domain-containing protein [Sulfidibacter corallicola]QTD48530.1 pre-peptidase C-terminal domain-containing protein [Sulfidibacter corallicola]